ncbi:tRNA (adenosine(37)-N6)-threonylcarbamoyltransferase complex dimerization subunit type 1 TsaB [Geomesophilobacter sediminis]|uniref:tRNA (Adenosine(37)-N6)-threonylcarbamoyltransferase complex dimerization subunit type 1 TsaB n=1 Tax=Geomesophilobacter sediminis TaxID=2798584 RepID=A0A8J7LU80_9BACT|nr:tRNA (adenosine(37)-N6)-threonylcarbamoyltransferase complex dimerization subunit type 1 TsaB [Geomesophilobacter sediminis]MBJ6723475.1 tRNA (adenosine(37)-N6)-threonylcarbamoyltransferase complex dimerization subunit type 1 TsaB [Geomesophilobacter sediminis]
MKILTVDTSSNCSSVALSDGASLLGEYLLGEDRLNSGRLFASIAKLLESARLAPTDLDAFAVAIGPGSFTGVRVGIATVKGLALAAAKPAVGFSSLAMLALNSPYCGFPVAPLFDARKKEVYAGLYRVTDLPEPLREDAVLAPESFLATIDEPTLFLGEGAVRYRDLITATLGDRARFAPFHADVPRAAAGAVIACDLARQGRFTPLELLNPTYIRPSEAEIAKQKRDASNSIS